MTLSFIIDMNLSPQWIAAFGKAGISAVHWSQVGDSRDSDSAIMDWAILNARVVLTHDLDFGAILATTHATAPSVVLLRGEDVLPETMSSTVIAAIIAYQAELERGALLVVDLRHARIRLLPFGA